MPDFSILFQSSPIIQVHTYSALTALLLGGFVLLSRKGDKLHKNLGKIWVLLMVVVAGSSFWINGIKMFGPFSPIHLLSIFALWSIYIGIRHIRAGRISEHQKTMRSLYLYALIGAGLLTMLPGRLLHNVFFVY